MVDTQRILALASDATTAAAGRKLATPTRWRNLGRDARLVWGECRGTALYEVCVDLVDERALCTCPSRRRPCKHALGLLWLAESGAVAEGVAPDWARARAEARAGSPRRRAAAVDAGARQKREATREQRVTRGIEGLDRFMADLIRTGLASLEAEPEVLETQAARLVDAQAPGLASRVRRLAWMVGQGLTWPERVLDRLGRIALVTHAWGRRHELAAPLVDELRQIIGAGADAREVLARGERVRDVWAVVAQRTQEDDRFRSQHSWLRGETSGRTALVLLFAPTMAPFSETIAFGTCFEAEVVFWPGATQARALVDARLGPEQVLRALPGTKSIAAALDEVAALVAQNPWQERTLLLLGGVVPCAHRGAFWLRDAEATALPLASRAPHLLLAISGGAPVDVAGEWNGERFTPLAVLEHGALHPLHGEDD